MHFFVLNNSFVLDLCNAKQINLKKNFEPVFKKELYIMHWNIELIKHDNQYFKKNVIATV